MRGCALAITRARGAIWRAATRARHTKSRAAAGFAAMVAHAASRLGRGGIALRGADAPAIDVAAQPVLTRRVRAAFRARAQTAFVGDAVAIVIHAIAGFGPGI